MKEQKDQWIDDILESGKDIKRAEPPSFLYSRIEQRVFSSKPRVVSMKEFGLIGVAAALLLFINVFSLRYYQQHSNQQEIVDENWSGDHQALISDYQLYR